MMSRKSTARLLVFFFLLPIAPLIYGQTPETASLGKVGVSFYLDKEGSPRYEVSFDGRPVIKPSGLGLALGFDSVFYKGFKLTGVERKEVDETWEPVWGETRTIRDHHEQLTIHLR